MRGETMTNSVRTSTTWNIYHSTTCSRQRWMFLTVFIILLLLHETDGFLPPYVSLSSSSSSSSSSWSQSSRSRIPLPVDQVDCRRLSLRKIPFSTLPLTAKPRRGIGPTSTTGGKKKKTKRDDSNKNKSLHEKELYRVSQKSSVALPSHKSRAPPWQVLSTKEAKQNVETEKKRRDLARQGILAMDNHPALLQLQQQQTTTPNIKSLSKSLLSDADRQIISWKRFNPNTVPCGLTFVGAYLDKRLPPRLGVPEICFLGRSNVGKSSLLNKLSSSVLGGGGGRNSNDGARVGKTPGATASVNLYTMLGKSSKHKNSNGATTTTTTTTATVNRKPILGLVDLPGFGYAKLSKEVQTAVQQAAERYLGNRQDLALGILLVDARRSPSEDDRAVLAALYDMGLPIVVVATKIDKLTKKEMEPAMETIRDRLGLPDGQPLCISSVTGEGTKELWKIIMEACETKVEELKDQLQRSGGGDEQFMKGEGPESIKLDEDGNPLLPDDDGEELGYTQGYDWIQDSAVTYQYGKGEISSKGQKLVDDHDDNYDEYIDDDDDAFQANRQGADAPFPKFKDLKKQIRRMERRGEI